MAPHTYDNSSAIRTALLGTVFLHSGNRAMARSISRRDPRDPLQTLRPDATPAAPLRAGECRSTHEKAACTAIILRFQWSAKGPPVPELALFCTIRPRPALLGPRPIRHHRKWALFVQLGPRRRHRHLAGLIHLPPARRLALFYRGLPHVQFAINPFPPSTCPSRRFGGIGFVSHSCPLGGTSQFRPPSPIRGRPGQIGFVSHDSLQPWPSLPVRRRLASFRMIGPRRVRGGRPQDRLNPQSEIYNLQLKNWLCFARCVHGHLPLPTSNSTFQIPPNLYTSPYYGPCCTNQHEKMDCAIARNRRKSLS